MENLSRAAWSRHCPFRSAMNRPISSFQSISRTKLCIHPIRFHGTDLAVVVNHDSTRMPLRGRGIVGLHRPSLATVPAPDREELR